MLPIYNTVFTQQIYHAMHISYFLKKLITLIIFYLF